MLDELKARLKELEALRERLPDAAIAAADVLRSKVNKRRAAARKRRAGDLRALKDAGASAAAIKAQRAAVKAQIKKGSGIKILAVADDDSATITASSEVHAMRRAKGETEGMTEAFAEVFRRKGPTSGRSLRAK